MRFIQCLAAAFVAVLWSTSVIAAPVNWTVTGTMNGGGTLSGSFTYDADTNTYSSINITTTAGTRGGATYTQLNGTLSTAGRIVVLTTLGAAPGLPVLSIDYPALTNAGGTLAINGGTEGDCNADCSGIQGTTRGHAGSLSGAVAAVPTMTEWAMILFGMVLAGGAALYIQRRQQSV